MKKAAKALKNYVLMEIYSFYGTTKDLNFRRVRASSADAAYEANWEVGTQLIVMSEDRVAMLIRRLQRAAGERVS